VGRWLGVEARPHLVLQAALGIAQLGHRAPHLVGRALGGAHGRRVSRRALQGQLEHPQELLPFALDLGARGVRPAAEHVERVLADPLQGAGIHQRTPESYPSFLLWAETGSSLHRSSTMLRSAAVSPRSMALRPSRTRACALGRSVAWSASEAARSKRR